jgi:heme/copper-type cytochrome/quinol oxidase subunit 3
MLITMINVSFSWHEALICWNVINAFRLFNNLLAPVYFLRISGKYWSKAMIISSGKVVLPWKCALYMTFCLFASFFSLMSNNYLVSGETRKWRVWVCVEEIPCLISMHTRDFMHLWTIPFNSEVQFIRL